MSYRSKYIHQLTDLDKKKLGVVWSTGGVERLQSIKPTHHEGVIVGYIGNLDFTKLNPNFIKLCEMVTNDSIKFVVVGGPVNSDLLIQAKNSKIANRIEFTGYVSEEEKWKRLSTFDIFGYPLAPHHFGSCDQTIQEAMAVSQDFEGDTRVVLFITLKNGAELTPEFEKEIKTELRVQASPRHVPDLIVAAPELPRTKSNKLVELAVGDVINGREVRNRDALANPLALDWFKQFAL